MCPEELVTLITALSIALSKNKTTNEINLLSVFFTQLGDTSNNFYSKRMFRIKF
jgi:hypothetical protein